MVARLKSLLQEQLGQGLQPRRLALALALGLTIGVFPSVFGVSLLCVIVAALLGLNQLVVQLTNYLVYPLQIVLFLPYFKLGARLFGLQSLPANPTSLLSLLCSQPLALAEQFWCASLQALAVWLLTTPLLFLTSFLLAQVFLRSLDLELLKNRPT